MTDDVGQVTIDETAFDDFFKRVKSIRQKATSEYYSTESNFHELAALVFALDVADRNLLYPTFGEMLEADPDKGSKMDKMLNRDSTVIGNCFEELLGLLKNWLGGNRRKPWCILDVLRAPIGQEGYKRFVRNQVLRLASALYRRYEQRMSVWQFLLYRCTADSGWSSDETRAVLVELLNADRSWLDVYSYGIRLRFKTFAELQSHECTSILTADFRAHPWAIDTVERLNSTLTRLTTSRGAHRGHVGASREHVLRQALNVHIGSGGSNPVGPVGGFGRPLKETLICTPFVPVACSDVGVDPRDPTTTAKASQPNPMDTDRSSVQVGVSTLAIPSEPFPTNVTELVRCNPPVVPESKAKGKTKGKRSGLSAKMLESNKSPRFAPSRGPIANSRRDGTIP